MIADLLLAMLATLSFSILFAAPSRHWFVCALVGGGGYLVYLLVLRRTADTAFACFVATLTLVILARVLANVLQTPILVFLLAGIFPLVPGSGIYFTAYYTFTSDPRAGEMGLRTIMQAGAIVLGTLFGFALPARFFALFGRRTPVSKKRR